MITFNDYIVQCSRAKIDNPEWRVGQTYFNVLYDIHPELADFFRGQVYDPFYNDHMLPTFLKLVAERWGLPHAQKGIE